MKETRMRKMLLAVCLAVLAVPAWAGDVVLTKLALVNYFGNGLWVAEVTATSTDPWPDFDASRPRALIDPQDVMDSGIMFYAEDKTHHFVWTGPASPDFPGLRGGGVQVVDKRVGALYQRNWNVAAQTDDVIDLTTGDAALGPYVNTTAPTAVWPVGVRVVVHLADVATIAQMLAGSFGPPLAHRRSDPCVVFRGGNTNVCTLAAPDGG